MLVLAGKREETKLGLIVPLNIKQNRHVLGINVIKGIAKCEPTAEFM